MNFSAKNFQIWSLVLVFGITWVRCASVSPRPEALPSCAELTPAAKEEARPAPPEPAFALKESPPPPVRPVIVRQEPTPAPPKEAEPRRPKEAFYVHTVRWSGESVSVIAFWYTGDGENWKALAQANPSINPNRIWGGNKILIPENLLKTREPMPKEFVDRFYSKSKKEKARVKAPPNQVQEEELKLVGPKKFW